MAGYVGTAIKKAVLEAKGFHLAEIPNFDEKKPVFWTENYKQRKRQILGSDHETAQEELDEFWGWYSEYLQSECWRNKRQRVLDRANGLCEGCREKEAVEIHHLSYKHKGDEFLFELVALCSACHDRIHREHENRSMNELRSL